MSRNLDVVSDEIWIRFAYDEEILATVRALPESRWRAGERAWIVPMRHFSVVVQRLESHRFKFTPAFRKEWESRRDELVDEPDGWTVSQINARVRGAIEGLFPEEIWVVGELQSFDRNSKTGHAWFELVERPVKGADPIAKISCVCFRTSRVKIGQKLRGFPDIAFRDGLEVRLLAQPDLYMASGVFQILVKDVDPYFTRGELQRRREEVIEAMRKLGIASANLERPWPRLPLRVALITSLSGDARRDFEVELDQSGYAFEVEVFEAAMQGENTEASVVEALRAVGARADDFDVACIVRGGGARSDLAFFDTVPIAEAVCRSPIKIVVGIGHQRDQCALDELAESAKTPTAAASLLVAKVRAAEEELVRLGDRLEKAIATRVDASRARWRDAAYKVSMGAPRRLLRSSRHLASLREGIAEGTRRRLGLAQGHLDRLDDRIGGRSAENLRSAARRLSYAEDGFQPERLLRLTHTAAQRTDRSEERLERAARGVIREQGRALDGLERAMRLVHPDRVIERGFAIVRMKGRVVTGAADIERGERLVVTMRDGDLVVDVVDSDLKE